MCLSVLPASVIPFSCLIVLFSNSLKHLVCVGFWPSATESMSSCKRRYKQVQPQLQRDIVEDYRRGVRGHGYFALAQKHGLPVRTVQHVVARGLRGDGDPVAPRGHKKRKLSGDDQTKLYRTIDQNARKDEGCCRAQNRGCESISGPAKQ